MILMLSSSYHSIGSVPIYAYIDTTTDTVNNESLVVLLLIGKYIMHYAHIIIHSKHDAAWSIIIDRIIYDDYT